MCASHNSPPFFVGNSPMYSLTIHLRLMLQLTTQLRHGAKAVGRFMGDDLPSQTGASAKISEAKLSTTPFQNHQKLTNPTFTGNIFFGENLAHWPSPTTESSGHLLESDVPNKTGVFVGHDAIRPTRTRRPPSTQEILGGYLPGMAKNGQRLVLKVYQSASAAVKSWIFMQTFCMYKAMNKTMNKNTTNLGPFKKGMKIGGFWAFWSENHILDAVVLTVHFCFSHGILATHRNLGEVATSLPPMLECLARTKKKLDPKFTGPSSKNWEHPT